MQDLSETVRNCVRRALKSSSIEPSQLHLGFPSPLFETPHHNSYRQELYRSEKRNYREDGGQTRSSKRRRFSSSSPPPRRRFQELNDLRVGYSDSSLLFNRRDHVILDTPEEQVILPVTEDKRFNKALVKIVRVGISVRGVVSQYIRSLHALEISITAIEDNDKDGESALLNGSISESHRSRNDGLRGLLFLDHEDKRECFCLRPCELERVEGVGVVPRQGIQVRLVLKHPDHHLISKIGQCHRTDDRDPFQSSWDATESLNIQRGYKILEELNFDVLLERSTKTYWKLPTGFFSNCRDFGLTASPLGHLSAVESIKEVLDPKADPNTDSLPLCPLSSLHSRPSLVEKIASDLKFGNPRSHLTRLKKVPSFLTVPSFLPIMSLSQLVNPHSEQLGMDPHNKSLPNALHQVQTRHWAESLVKSGVQLARDGKYLAAIELYEAALTNMPTCVDAFVARGAARANLGQFDEALRDFDAALSEDSTSENAKRYREKTIQQKFKNQIRSIRSSTTGASGLGHGVDQKILDHHRSSQSSSAFLLDWKDEQKRLEKYR